MSHFCLHGLPSVERSITNNQDQEAALGVLTMPAGPGDFSENLGGNSPLLTTGFFPLFLR